jgi:hypothetical protein
MCWHIGLAVKKQVVSLLGDVAISVFSFVFSLYLRECVGDPTGTSFAVRAVSFPLPPLLIAAGALHQILVDRFSFWIDLCSSL